MPSKIDIDALARAAQKETAAPPPVKRAPLTAASLGALTCNWQILVEPREISEAFSDSVLVKPKISQQIEEVKTTIGRVLDLGPTALDGKTPSGIQIDKVARGITGEDARDMLVGKWVIYQRYTGHPVYNTKFERKVVVLTISELLLIVDNPDDWDCDV